MTTYPLDPQIHYLGVNDFETDLFEALWPIPEGVSYNAYLIKDERNCLIDTVDQDFTQEYLKQVEELLSGEEVDYLVINHMEPDHSGAISALLDKYPQLKIVGNHKTIGFLEGFYQIGAEQVHEVKSQDTLSLGKHQLEFTQIPMVHWPETMVSYETSRQTLFAGDAFGGFKALENGVFDSDYSQSELAKYISEARRYFSNIIGAYTRPTKRAVKTIKKLSPKTIAPAHGLIWRNQPDKIIDLYLAWSQHQAEAKVSVIYGSMYGHTKELAEKIAHQLNELGLSTKLLDAARVHRSYLIDAVWESQGVVLASSTYTNAAFPGISHLLQALTERKIENKVIGLAANYSWTGGALKELENFCSDLRITPVEPKIRTQYRSTQEQDKEIKQLAAKMKEQLQNLSLKHS